MARPFKVITVCGAGVGTSTLLRMNVDKVFGRINAPLDVTVENKGLSVAKGLQCDCVLTFASFEEDLRPYYPDLIVINNLMNLKEIEEKVRELLKKKEII